MAQSKVDLGKVASAYAGTSVGSLLVALAAMGMSWAEIADIFQCECPRIFEKPSFWWRINPRRPKYDGKALRAAAQKYFGGARMCDLPTPTFLTAFDFKVGRPKVFDCKDDVPVWYAVMCSTAAPTYFPIIDGRYGDGGLVANNPAMVGIAGGVSKLGWKLKDMWCLSLGTNGDAWRDPKVARKSKIGWLKPLFDTFMTGNEELGTFQAKTLLGDHLLRIEPKLDEAYDLDDVDIAMGIYNQIWASLYREKEDEFLSWLKAAGGIDATVGK